MYANELYALDVDPYNSDSGLVTDLEARALDLIKCDAAPLAHAMEDAVRVAEEVFWCVELLLSQTREHSIHTVTTYTYGDLTGIKDEDAVVRDDCPQTVYDAGINQFWGAEVGI